MERKKIEKIQNKNKTKESKENKVDKSSCFKWILINGAVSKSKILMDILNS